MVSFLFWNVAKREETFPFIARLAVTYAIDIFFLAECPGEADELPALLNAQGCGVYRIADRGFTKVRGIARLPATDFFPHFNNLHGDMTIWNLATSDPAKVQTQIAVVHLLSKAGGANEAAQQEVASVVAREIAEYEDAEGCQDTVLVGDVNMNPFEPGMVSVSGFHGAMTRRLAQRPDRSWRQESYRRFYNPMWGLFGDRTPGPPGTHYWNSAMTANQHWHIYDQVLLRPSLMDRLRNVQILDTDGYQSLLDNNATATKEHLSDHLPLLFELDV